MLNFANPDMVGHTGDLKAAIRQWKLWTMTLENFKGLKGKGRSSNNYCRPWKL
nr:hypothetical protein [Peptoniphilus harei]